MRHQTDKIVPLVAELRIVIRAEMRDENLLGYSAHLLDKPAQLVSFYLPWQRVDHRAQLAAVAVGYLLEHPGRVALLKGLVCLLKHHRRVSCRQVTRVRHGPGVVEDLAKLASRRPIVEESEGPDGMVEHVGSNRSICSVPAGGWNSRVLKAS